MAFCNGPFSADVSRAHTNVSDSGKQPTNQLLATYTKVLSSLTVFTITNITINPLKSHSTRPKNLMYYACAGHIYIYIHSPPKPEQLHCPLQMAYIKENTRWR